MDNGLIGVSGHRSQPCSVLKPAAWNLEGTTKPLVPNTPMPTPPTAYQMPDSPRFYFEDPRSHVSPWVCPNTPERTGTLRTRSGKPDPSSVRKVTTHDRHNIIN
jgi:hypothetical protein